MARPFFRGCDRDRDDGRPVSRRDEHRPRPSTAPAVADSLGLEGARLPAPDSASRAELARLLPEAGAAGPPPGSSDALRLFESVTQLIEQLAARQPLLQALGVLAGLPETPSRLAEAFEIRLELRPVLIQLGEGLATGVRAPDIAHRLGDLRLRIFAKSSHTFDTACPSSWTCLKMAPLSPALCCRYRRARRVPTSSLLPPDYTPRG